MKYGLGRSIVAMTAIGAGSLELAKAIINTFSFDIFAGCVDGTYLPTDNICQYGPQMSINVLAMVFFFGATLYLLNDNIKKVARSVMARIAVHSVVFMLLLTFVWRMQLSLQDNFVLFAGPQTLEEYLYVGFVWADVILIGVVLGLFWWLPGRVSANAKTRKEPRVTFESSAAPAAKKTPAKKAPAKKKPAAKKTAAKKKS